MYNAFNRGRFCVGCEQEAKETVYHRAYTHNIAQPDGNRPIEEVINRGNAQGKGLTHEPSMVID